MRILITLCLVLASATACGKKKSAQSPANASPAAESAGGDMQEKNAPTDPDDAKKKGDSADPCEGGE